MTWPPAEATLGERVDVVGVGEPLVLLQPRAGSRLDSASVLEVHVAGAELNACAAVASLGGLAVLCTRIGADPLGRQVLDHVHCLGVRLEAETDHSRPTGVFFKDVAADGLRHVYYYRSGSAGSAMSASDARRALAMHPRSILVSGITAALGSGPADAVREAAAGAAQAGAAVVLDVNLRPQLGNLEESVDTLRSILARVDLLVLGVDDAELLFGTAQLPAIIDAALGAGCREIVITDGARGSWWVDDHAQPHHQVTLARSVVDPVGAGDAFTGGYLASRLAGHDAADASVTGATLAAAVAGATGDTAGLPSRPPGRGTRNPT
jgi:2-dehydro-3-deoxygluconokinase